ncbi:MAG: Crp/Fnr family transcriptional regulator [Bacteroidia bacterium]
MEVFFRQLPYLEPDLRTLVETQGRVVTVPAGAVMLDEGAYVHSVPVVLEGLLKVERRDTERELLLYYIQPGESCIMSFQAVMQHSPSSVIAGAEQDTVVLLLAEGAFQQWFRRFPSLQGYFMSLFGRRYEGLIQTIDQLAFRRLDDRLLAYLQEKTRNLRTHELSLTHQQIASELGSTREVISRLLKKLEKEGRVQLGRNHIVVV